MNSGPPIALAGGGVRIADVVRVARDGVEVSVTEDALARVTKARAVVDSLAASDMPFYGVNSALGANTGKTIPQAERNSYQLRAVRARAVGIGPRHPRDVVRAAMFVRAAGMACGGSGVSPAVLQMLVELLNAGVHPVVPSRGSIGVADLAPLSHIALVLVGEGQAELGGNVMPGSDALTRAGLAPVMLGPKDGLALISANAATVGHAALVLHDCARALDALNVAAALSFEGFRANLSPLDPRVQAARPARGQRAIAGRLVALLEGSSLWRHGAAAPPAGSTVVPVRHAGAWRRAGGTAARRPKTWRWSLTSAADSPLVLPDTNEMLSNGNFHLPGLALAFDSLGLALSHCATLCVARCQRMYSPSFSELPLQLTSRGPEHSGFATIQKTLTALANEIRHLANPASLDAMPVSEAVEDHAPMAANVVAKTAKAVPLLRDLAAIELLTAAQATDLRPVAIDELGRGTREAYEFVRARVAMLDEDRSLGPDIEQIAAAIDELPLADLLAAE